MIPAELVQERRRAFNEQEDARKSELGCAAFVSSLAGVDGLILLSKGLRVSGFGVEIKKRKDPAKVFSAGNATGTPSSLKSLELKNFGTRHRSMMRYCDSHPGSIGFVISQDGDVRAITKGANGLIVWENIQLQEIEVEGRNADKQSATHKAKGRQLEIEAQLSRSLYFERIDNNKGRMLKRQFWSTRSGDPLKVVNEIKNPHVNNLQEIYFDEDGYVFLENTREEKVEGRNEIVVKEESNHFQLWRLTEKTQKISRFDQGEQIDMTAVRARRVDLSEIDEGDRSPARLLEQGYEDIRAVLEKRKSPKRHAYSFDGVSNRFSFIQGTSSPDGRYALGFELTQAAEKWTAVDGTLDFMRQHYSADLEQLEGRASNYVINLETNSIVGETGCNYIGTRDQFNHRRCEAIWSKNNRFVAQHYHGKWHTIKATIVRIADDGRSVLKVDLNNAINKYAAVFLRRTKNRAFRKNGFERFAVSFSCLKISDAGLVDVKVFGEIPKAAEEDAMFSIIQRFRIVKNVNGIVLRFLGSRPGPEIY